MFTDGSDFTVVLSGVNGEARATPLVKKLRSFARLPHGWSNGAGVPVAAETIRVAEYFASTATQLQLRADVFPGLNGECGVAFYEGNRSVEVVIDPGDLQHVDFHVEEGLGFEFKRVEDQINATPSEAVKRIVSLLVDKWKSRESSRSSRSMEPEADFQTWFSSIPQGSPLIRQTRS